MIYISPQNEYPRHAGDIQLANPGWKADDPLPTGWVQVAQTDRPLVELNEVAYEGFPIEVDGVMTQNWEVRPMTAEEIERRDAPANAKAKLMELGLTEIEITALVNGLVR